MSNPFVIKWSPNKGGFVDFNAGAAGATAVDFTPNLISGLSVWLDANDSATINVSPSTTSVTQWNDKSGNGYNFTNPDGYYPTTGNSTLNGKNILNFDTNKSLRNSTISSPNTSCSIFVIGYTSNAASYCYVLKTYDDKYLFFGAEVGKYAVFFGNGTWNNGTTQVAENYSVASLCLMEVTNDNTTCRPYFNGATGTTKGGASAIDPTTGLHIGRSNTAYNDQPWNGYIGEIIIYNKVLSDENRQKIEGYLAWKWGIQTSLPTIHPYYSSKPMVTPSSIIAPSGLYYFKFLNGDITGTNIKNYGTLGGNGTITNTSSSVSISTSMYPQGKSQSSLQLNLVNAASMNGGTGYITIPSYTWTEPSGVTIAFWYTVGSVMTDAQAQALAYVLFGSGSYSSFNFTHASNIGYSGTFTYNGKTYNAAQAATFYHNTYTNGANTGAIGTWYVAAVPFLQAGVWNHIAITIQGTYSSPTWTFYFNGTAYPLSSSRNTGTFFATNVTPPLGYPNNAFSGTQSSFNINFPGNYRDFFFTNRELSSLEINNLMNAS